MTWSLRNFRKRLSLEPLTRRKAWSKYFERRLRRYDLYLYKSHLNWTLSPELRALHRDWGDDPGLPPDRCSLLYDLARLVRHREVPGDTAECGVRYGKSTFFLMRALDDPQRPHHLFDAFAGLSDSRPEDAVATGLKAWAKGDISVPETRTRDNLARFTNCEFHVGWIPDRFADVADRSFALVHIDVDLYQPTHDALEFFWPRLSPGGLVVCDDYGFATCPGATKAFDRFFAQRPEGILPIPTGQCVVWKDAASTGVQR